MIDQTFLLGTLALLAAPGPTNALLFTAGATQGLRGGAPLAVSAVSGYIISVSVLVFLIGPAFTAMPWLANAIRLLICGYLLALSWSLWSKSKAEQSASAVVTARHVGITTLLNPKAAVIAFALFPTAATHDWPDAAATFASLALLITTLSLSWIALGIGASRASFQLRKPAIYFRLSAAAMLTFAIVLAGGLVAGA